MQVPVCVESGVTPPPLTMNVFSLASTQLYHPQRGLLAATPRSTPRLVTKALRRHTQEHFNESLEKLESFFATTPGPPPGEHRYQHLGRRHQRMKHWQDTEGAQSFDESEGEGEVENTTYEEHGVVEEAVSSPAPAVVAAVESQVQVPSSATVSALLDQASTFTQEQLHNLQQAASLAAQRATELRHQTSSKIQKGVSSGIAALEPHRTHAISHAQIELKRFTSTLDCQMYNLRASLAEMRDLTAQKADAMKSYVGSLSGPSTAAATPVGGKAQPVASWLDQAGGNAQIAVLQQRIAALWHQIVITAQKIILEIQRMGQSAQAHVKPAVDNGVEVLKLQQQRLISMLPGKQTKSAVKTPTAGSPSTAPKQAAPTPDATTIIKQNTSQAQSSIVGAQRTGQGQVSTTSPLNGAVAEVQHRWKTFSAAVPQPKIPTIDRAKLKQGMLQYSWAIALSCAIAAALGWQLTLRSKRDQLQSQVREAEVRAKAKRALDRQKDRFKKALLVDETFEGSIDTSVLEAMKRRKSSPLPSFSSSETPISANPFLASVDVAAVQRLFEEKPTTPSEDQLEPAGGVPNTNVAGNGLLDEEESSLLDESPNEEENGSEAESESEDDIFDPRGWDETTRRDWEAFVKKSKVGQGKLWDSSDVDEGIPKIWVDLNKE